MERRNSCSLITVDINKLLEVIPIAKAKERTNGVSKKLLYIIFSVTGVIIIFALALMWKTGDLSPFAYLIPAIFVEVATATGFYYWKSKAENQIKLRAQYGQLYKEEETKDEFYN